MTARPQVPNKEVSGRIEKGELIDRLKTWASYLSEIDQEEDKTELSQIRDSLVSPDLLDYQDTDVKLFVACCAADVLRIYAPEAPYADEQLKEIFMLFVDQLRGLEDLEGKCFKRYFYLLENLACVKTFILCMELDAPNIILSLFRTFFQIFTDRHVGKVQTFMVDIMMTVMQEGDTIPQDVMDIILMHIIQPYKSRKPAAHRLAKELINKSASYMEPVIQKFFNSALINGMETDSGLHSRVYDLIKELNRVCPNILLAVLPQLQEKLKSSDVNERLEVTRLLAEMFSDKGSELATQNKHLWNCFLRRFNDIEAAVRAECVSTCKNFILNHLKLSDDCYQNLYKRHRDPDEKVRLEAVKVVYAIAAEDITRMTPQLFDILRERMLDKKWPIRHQAIMNVARLYKEINSKKDQTKISQVSWMPNKVLHHYYQNTPQDRLLVERLLLSCIVPVSLKANDRMNILLRTYCMLDTAAIKALSELLKYQQTIRMHLAALLNAIDQGIGEEDRRKLLNQVTMLSRSLPDTKTATSDLKRLSNTLVHDRSLLKAFQTIVTPGVSCQQVARAVSEIMKKLTPKNPIMDTIRALMDRTAPVLADATCITVLVNLVTTLLACPHQVEEDEEDKFNVFINGQKGLHLLLSLATVYPGQFKAQEVYEELLVNLKNPNNDVVLMTLKILTKTAHSLDRIHPTVAGCLQPMLIKISKEGTPKQAKQAINIIQVVYKDSARVLERLLESMVTSLSIDLPKLPTTVKSIGQIAKLSPAVFENFSREVVRDFIVTQVLTQDNEAREEGLVEDEYWCEDHELSQDAQVKAESLHVMVNWVAKTAGDKSIISTPVLKLLWALLQQKGDLNGAREIRLCSMSHLRLHAGMCVLKLAEEPLCFDLITLELFQEVAWLIQDPCPEVKQAILTKLQKGLTSMRLPLEYVALLAFFATDVGKERRSKARQILLRVIQLRRDYMMMNSSNSERNHTVLPEYALPTLLHLLAHHPTMDIERDDSLRSSLDVLWWFLEPLMQKNDNFPFLKKLVESVKQAVDAQDPFNDVINERLYAICDLAFGVINVKCASVKLPPFPGEVKLSVKFFAPPESSVQNTKLYIPEKYDFSPHRVPVAVEMEIDHPTVKKHVVKAADIPLKKKSLVKKKFGTKKKKLSEEEEAKLAEELDEHVMQDEVEEDQEEEEEKEEAPEETPEEELEYILRMEERIYAKKQQDSLTAKAKIRPKIVLKKQHVSQEELFPDPVLPKIKPSKHDNKPQRIIHVKTKAVKQKQKFSNDFDTMYEQKKAKEVVVPLPEKRLTLISTRRQKRIGLDQVEVGESPATYDIKKEVYRCSTPKRLAMPDTDYDLNKDAESVEEAQENDFIVEADEDDEDGKDLNTDEKENENDDLPSAKLEESPIKKASPAKRNLMDVSMEDLIDNPAFNVSMTDAMDISMADDDEPEIKIKRRKSLRRGES